MSTGGALKSEPSHRVGTTLRRPGCGVASVTTWLSAFGRSSGALGGPRAMPASCVVVVLGAGAVVAFAPMTLNLAERITVNPAQCGGRPCIRGMRSRVSDVIDLLAVGLSREQVLAELPDLQPEDVEAALRFASQRGDHAVVAA